MKNIFCGIGLLFLIACGAGNEKAAEKTDTLSKNETALRPENIPLERDSVKPEPVAEYKVKTENPLNDWYFQVRLYETPRTFHYLIKLQFEEIRGQDTLKLPNFGTPPNPVIQKGPDRYSCIIGFMDKENKFREYKKVYVKENTLKIEALKHYGVRG
jgi:hypothetical protein